MRATSSGIMAQQRPDAASNERGKWLHDSQTVMHSLKRPAMVVGMRLSGKSPFERVYGAKYPNAVACLMKDEAELLAFYNFPAEHWKHIRTTNTIESAFATVRLRTAKTRGCLSRWTALTMVFQLCRCAQNRWRRLTGYELLRKVIEGIVFKDGVEEIAA